MKKYGHFNTIQFRFISVLHLIDNRLSISLTIMLSIKTIMAVELKILLKMSVSSKSEMKYSNIWLSNQSNAKKKTWALVLLRLTG